METNLRLMLIRLLMINYISMILMAIQELSGSSLYTLYNI